jgi:hypothetical protein
MNLIIEISKKNYDRAGFVYKAINNKGIRNEIIDNIKNKQIMVYYHCFEVINDASKIYTEVFYEYWEIFEDLLNHSNSYHRDIGLTIISNISSVDKDNKMKNCIHQYLNHMYDTKYMTALCCIRCLSNITLNNQEYCGMIENEVLKMVKPDYYTEKQMALLMCDVIDLLSTLYPNSKKKHEIISLIRMNENSLSPKTKSKAKAVLKMLG